MSIRTRKSYFLKNNDGSYARFFFDGTTLTLYVNDVVVATWTTSGEGQQATLLPATDASFDLGSASFQWRDLFVSRNITSSGGFFRGSVGNALTAFSGGGQSSALALTKQFNFVSTVAAAGDSVRLPASVAGEWVTVFNGGANSLQVFGAGTDTIDGIATGTGEPLAAGKIGIYYCNAAGTWVSGNNKAALPQGKYTLDSSDTTGFTATGAQMAGAESVVFDCTGTLGSGQTITPPTVANLIAAIPNAFVGQTYRLRVMNRSSANFAWTIGAQTGYTLTGTMTIAQNTYREFLVTLTSLKAIVFQSLGQVIVA